MNQLLVSGAQGNSCFPGGASARDDRIQVLRAIAIIAVVLIHTAPLGMYQVLGRPFLNFSVALFIFLSGYLTREQGGHWLRFYIRRITRVLVPYIIWSVVYTLPDDNWFSYVYNLLTTKSIYTLYYLSVYVQLVLLTPLLFKLAKSAYSWAGWVITPVSMLIFKYSGWFFGVEFHKHIELVASISCQSWLTYYYMGIIIRGKEESICLSLKKIAVFVAIALCFQVAEGYALLLKAGELVCGTQIKLSALITNIGILMLAVCYIKSRMSSPVHSILVLIGNYSFGIYLVHPLLIKCLSWMSLYQYLPYGINTTLVLGGSLLLVACSSKVCGPRVSTWFGFQ